MKDKTIGFAIVGTGSIAENHAKAIAAVEGAELRAVFNRNPDKARSFAAHYPAEVERELPGLLQRRDVDVVCITTPTGAHAEIALPAFEAGKHVLCEKPLDINIQRTEQMIKSAEKNRRILACVFQSRFGKGAQTVKKAIEAGRFGRLTLCNVQTRWWRTQEYYDEGGWRGTWDLDGGGALMNQGIHGVDLLQWLVGMPEAVHAFAATLAHHGIETEDTLLANLKYSSGALGSIECATSAYPGFARTIEISGSRGSAFLKDDTITTWEFVDELPGDDEIRNAEADSQLKSGASDPKAITTYGHQKHVEDLVQAIRDNAPVAIPGTEGRNAVALIEAIYRSTRSGQIEPVT